MKTIPQELLNQLTQGFKASDQRKNYFLCIKHFTYNADPRVKWYSGFESREEVQNFIKHQEDNRNQQYDTQEYSREYYIRKGTKLLKKDIFLAKPKETLVK